MKRITKLSVAAATFLLSSLLAVSVAAQEVVPQEAAAATTAAPSICPLDDRDVYIITSRLDGWWPKFGPLRHASIVICPKGVSPIVYEHGVPVSNCEQCQAYGTQTWWRGFQREGKRIGVRATRLDGVSATNVLQKMRRHSRLNIPLLQDCRHHAIEVTGVRGTFFQRKLAMSLQ